MPSSLSHHFVMPFSSSHATLHKASTNTFPPLLIQVMQKSWNFRNFTAIKVMSLFNLQLDVTPFIIAFTITYESPSRWTFKIFMLTANSTDNKATYASASLLVPYWSLFVPLKRRIPQSSWATQPAPEMPEFPLEAPSKFILTHPCSGLLHNSSSFLWSST